MRILLDENFPLPLYYRLRAAGYAVEHIITLGQRGIPDSSIRTRLVQEDLLFLTNDTEFEDVRADDRAQVIISRVPQQLPIDQRVEVWFAAVEQFIRNKPPGKLFDLLANGEIIPWDIRDTE